MKFLYSALALVFIFNQHLVFAADSGSDDGLRTEFEETPILSPENDRSTGASDFYKNLIADTRVWRKGAHAFASCVERVKQYQCENSPWRTLGLRERYNTLMSMVEPKLKDYHLNGLENAIPCFMTRETDDLEPLQISRMNCDPGKKWVTDQGIGQVTFTTFCNLLGLTTKEIHAIAHGGKLSYERAEKLNSLTNVAPYNSIEYRQDPLRMFDELSDSLEFQIDVVLKVLQQKQDLSDLIYRRSSEANPPVSKSSLFLTVENYNGSETKHDYAETVTACTQCLNTGDEDPIHCLGLAIHAKNLKDYTPCK
jgi:hypothetical protein